MKLRVNESSLRLGVSRSELERFIRWGRIQETIHFGSPTEAKLTYSLEWNVSVNETTINCRSNEVMVQIPVELAYAWGMSDLTGMSNRIDLGSTGTLDIVVEKDFVCIDQSEVDNEHMFTNPDCGLVC